MRKQSSPIIHPHNRIFACHTMWGPGKPFDKTGCNRNIDGGEKCTITTLSIKTPQAHAVLTVAYTECRYDERRCDERRSVTKFYKFYCSNRTCPANAWISIDCTCPNVVTADADADVDVVVKTKSVLLGRNYKTVYVSTLSQSQPYSITVLPRVLHSGKLQPSQEILDYY
jgi:hypothetical protein